MVISPILLVGKLREARKLALGHTICWQPREGENSQPLASGRGSDNWTSARPGRGRGG